MKKRLTSSITSVGACVTEHNTMKHYHPCIVCRNKATIVNGKSEKFDFCDTCVLKELFEKLKEYEDAEEQGLLVKFPCNIGDDVYFIPSEVNYKLNILNKMSESNRVYHQKVASITINSNGWYVELDKDIEFGTDRICIDALFKKTWFLSRQEAEQALAKLESEAQNE